MNAFITVAGWTLLHFVWQGVLIALAAAAALRLLRSASPQRRYLVSCAALAAMLASPVVTARLLNASPRATETMSLSGLAAPGSSAGGFRLKPEATNQGSIVAAAWSRLDVDALLPIVLALWLGGVTFLLIRLAGGWWRVRRLHRDALAKATSRWQSVGERIGSRLGLRRFVHVVDSALVDTPIVVGWLRPVILLPIAALAQLTPAQVDAILAHELAHIRRHDFVVNLLQTFAETLLFYHPAVWWASSRIRIEREHCCDEVAVDVCGDAIGYAAALAELETQRTEHSAFALAATGGSLLDRVRRVLGARASETPRIGNATMIAALVLIFIVAAGALQLMFARQTHGSPAAAARRHLEDLVARTNERVGNSDQSQPVAWKMVFNHPTGEMAFKGFTGRELVRFAYQLPGSGIVGGPAWIDTETFDLSTTLDSAPAAEEMPGVVRELLERRFNLSAHEETRDFPVYALVIARPDGALGSHLQPSTSDCFDQQEWIAAGRPRIQPNQIRSFCGVWGNGLDGVSAEKVTMAELAEYLSRPGPILNRLVVDRTGLDGTFDVKLDVFMPAVATMGQHPRLTAALEPLGIRSLPTALREQLGLELEDATAPSNVLVIDRAERPTPALATNVARGRAEARRYSPSLQASNATVYKAGDGVVLPVPLKKVDAQYPAKAKEERIQGTVTVTTVVGTDGGASDVRVTKPVNKLLDDEAVNAVRQWRFRPGTKDGKAVPVEISIEIGFALEGPTYKAGADGVTMPVPIRQVRPEYSQAELSAGIQGVVKLEGVVMPDGSVGKTSVLESLDPALDEQALQALKQWRFKPGTKDGQPVPVLVAFEMTFTLK